MYAGKAPLSVPAFTEDSFRSSCSWWKVWALLGKGETMKASKMVAVAALLVAGGAAMADITIETVTVGNPGNAADTRYNSISVGAVTYTYNIGKYEVTAGQYTEFLNKVAGVDTYGLYATGMWSNSLGCRIERYDGNGTPGDPYQYRVANDWANRPVNYVSWGDAARFANWLHNGQLTGAQDLSTTEDGAYYLNGAMTNEELLALSISRKADWKWAVTSEDEWYKAAYYSGVAGVYYDHATGRDTAPMAEEPPGTDMTSGSANYELVVGGPTDVGAYMAKPSESPYGTFDQAGNVNEWNEAIIESGASYRGFRGGSFRSRTASSFFLHAAGRGSGTPTWKLSYIGFRVVEVPEPGTLSLLALGGLAVLRRRKRTGPRGVLSKVTFSESSDHETA